ncbi:hypothetical protein LDENG_00190870 [Lucifuga dentata]|nr:hypothetical protein LDENG_00190870 [Lucifuga dentata]
MISSSLEGPQLIPGPSAGLSSCTPAGSLLDRKAAGEPSAGSLLQRRHPPSLPDAKLSQNHFFTHLKTSSSALPSSNKENRVRGRSYSETGVRLRLCVDANGQVNLSRYKTELCRPFEENASCKYGDKCQFAHGMHELRSLSRHPKYKTELCRTFHTVGFCPYGPRCHFIHNAEERRGPPPLSAFNKLERPRLQHSFSFAGFPSSASPEDGPAPATPPAAFSTDDLTEWHRNPFTHSSLFGPSAGPPPAFEPQGLTPSSPTKEDGFVQSMSESLSPPTPSSPTKEDGFVQSMSESLSPPRSLPDQQDYQSSDSALQDAARRLPIFSSLSTSD